MQFPVIIGAFLSLLLAVPALADECSLKRLGRAFCISGFGVVLPVLLFFGSVFLTPAWKGVCNHDWLDCLHQGKLLLAPVVLWAAFNLYVVEIFRFAPPYSRDLVMGLFLGCLVASGSFLHGVIAFGARGGGLLIVPLYVAIWLGWRWWQAHRQSPPGFFWYCAYLCSSLPLWIGSVIWSRRIYAALPDQPPGCFVVTAAARGHARLVGPFVEVRRRGQPRRVNLQLCRFWEFELAWSRSFPAAHHWFRAGYNRLGPMVARQITSPCKADLAYLALKPVEWLACLLTPQFRRCGERCLFL